jgi:hypothetical protein
MNAIDEPVCSPGTAMGVLCSLDIPGAPEGMESQRVDLRPAKASCVGIGKLFSVKGHIVNICDFSVQKSQFQLFSSDAVTQKLL